MEDDGIEDSTIVLLILVLLFISLLLGSTYTEAFWEFMYGTNL